MFLAAFISIAKGGIPELGFVMYGEIRNDLGGVNARLTSGTLTWTLYRKGAVPDRTNLIDQYQ